MSRPVRPARRSLRALLVSMGILALLGAALPAATVAEQSYALRYIVVFKGDYALDGKYALGGDYALNHQYALRAVRGSGGTVVADLSRESGVMIVDSAKSAFASTLRTYALVAAVGRSFAWKAFPTMQEAIASGQLTVVDGAATTGTAGDPLKSQLWNMRQIRAFRAHATEDGWRRVQVGVLDTGVDSTHLDFMKDGTSNIDTVRARSFVDGSPDALTDDGFHGTHVAGIIAAQADNDVGVVGVAPGVTIVPIKVCETSTHCYADAVIQGINYAGSIRLEAINMSFFVDDDFPAGSTQFKCLSDPDQRAWRIAVERSINYARYRGVAPIAAIGNNDLDLNHPGELQEGATDDDCDQLPSETPGVTAVVALGPESMKSDYSSYGRGKADVSAPGGDGAVTGASCDDQILSTLPGNTYGCIQGTSMASPHVAGVAALIISRFGVLHDGDVRMPVDSVDSILKQTTIDIGREGYDTCYGWGRVDAVRAIHNRINDVWQQNGCSDY